MGGSEALALPLCHIHLPASLPTRPPGAGAGSFQASDSAKVAGPLENSHPFSRENFWKFWLRLWARSGRFLYRPSWVSHTTGAPQSNLPPCLNNQGDPRPISGHFPCRARHAEEVKGGRWAGVTDSSGPQQRTMKITALDR